MLAEIWQVVIEELERWRELLASTLPHLAVALLVLLLFLPIARFVAGGVERSVARLADTAVLGRVAASLVRTTVFLVGLFIALEILGLGKAVTSMLAGAGIIGLAVGLAFHDLAANFIAGMLLAYRKPFDIDQLIESNGHKGFVRKLNLRNTLIETFEGQLVLLPNRLVFENPLENYNYTGRRRVDFKVPVPFEVDADHARRKAEEAVRRLPWLAEDKPVEAFALDFGERGLDLQVRYWVVYPGQKDYFEAIHDGVAAVRQAFQEAGIPINYRVETRHIHWPGDERWRRGESS